MSCLDNTDILRIVGGNSFQISITVKARRVSDGSEIEDFDLSASSPVLNLIHAGEKTRKYFVTQGNQAIISFDGGEGLGYYGMEMYGSYNSEAWRFCIEKVLQLVDTNAKANIPEWSVLVDDTYFVEGTISIYGGGGGGDTVQADWAETNPTSAAFILHKPDLSVYATKTEVASGLAGKQDTIVDLTSIRYGAAAGATAYQKPVSGIPESDMSEGVQSALDKAEDAYQKPSSGIPATDMSESVQASLEKANSAVQTETDPVFSNSPAAEITQTDINAWNAKQSAIADLADIREGAAAGATAVQPDEMAQAIDEVDGDIADINAKIPTAASNLNQLADKAYVNSSIATNSATYRGSFNLITDLGMNVDATHTQIAGALATAIVTADNNDYAFVQIPDSASTPTVIAKIERYKHNGTGWIYEYDLNNSGFTAAQWAAINSGVTSGLVGKLSDLPNNSELATLLNGKQNVINDLSAIRSGAAAGATAVQPADLTEALNDVEEEIAGLDESKQDTIEDLSTIRSGAAAGATAYQKPVTGIPESDMSEGVQSALDKAEDAYQLPANGIPASDMDSEVQAALDKANSAVQTETDPVFSGSPAAEISQTDINNWNAKQSAIADLADIREGAAAGATAVQPDEMAQAIDEVDGDIADINAKIPAAASNLNQLADKAYVNSSIATNSATYRGSFNLITDLGMNVDATHTQIAGALATAIATADNNDYAFVQIPDSASTPTVIAKIERYKHNGSGWVYEYDLNNSGFTSAQWAAINSGITSGLVGKLADLPNNSELATLLNGKQNVINDLATIRSGASAGATAYQKPSGGIPASDMSSTVQQELSKANTAVQTETDPIFSESPAAGITAQNIQTWNGEPAARQAADTALQNSVSTLQTDLAAETSARQSADTALQTAIQNEATARATADALLQQQYNALTQSDIIVGDLPATGVPNVIYRVPGTTDFTDYMWYDGQFVPMATYGLPISAEFVVDNNLNKTQEEVNELAAGVFDISVANAVEGTPATYADLSAALGTNGANVPQGFRKGGMSVKFVQTSDNNYVQYRYMGTSTANADITNVNNWQGVVDDIPNTLADEISKDNIISSKLFLRNASYYLNSLGVITHYFNGFVNQQGGVNTSGDAKCAFFKVFPNHTYRVFRPSGASNSVCCYSFFDEDFLKTVDEYIYPGDGTNRWFKIQVPDNNDIVYLAMTIAFQDSSENYRNVCFIEENAYIKAIDGKIESIENVVERTSYKIKGDYTTITSWDGNGYYKGSGNIQEISSWRYKKIEIPNNTAEINLKHIGIPSDGLVVCVFFAEDSTTIVKIVEAQASSGDTNVYDIIAPLKAKYIGINYYSHSSNSCSISFDTFGDISEDFPQSIEELRDYVDESVSEVELPLVKVTNTYKSSNILSYHLDDWNVGAYIDNTWTTPSSSYGSQYVDVSEYPVGTVFYFRNSSNSAISNRWGVFLNANKTQRVTTPAGNVSQIEKTSVDCAILGFSYFFGSLEAQTEANFKKLGVFAVKPSDPQEIPVFEYNYDTYSKEYAKKSDNYENNAQDEDAVAFLSDLENVNVSDELTVANSDKIILIGDSYTESHYTVKGKAYINKLSLFSDYNFANFGKSGDTYNGRLYAIRQNTPIYGNVTFKEYHPKYAMMVCFTNDIKYENVNTYIDYLQNTINVIKGLGVEPIICTEYHTGGGITTNVVRSALRNIAIKNNLLYWDIASFVDIIRGADYVPFWGGSHPGTRTNAIESDNYEKYLYGLERPMRSLKLFRLRNANDAQTNDLDNFMFSTNEERAKLFKEIFVGHSALNSSALVDNCTEQANSQIQDEYGKLIKHEDVQFNKICLISAVLPYISINDVSLVLSVDSEVNVYVRNTMASPYPSATKYTRFDFNSIDVEPQVGAIYTASNGQSGVQYEVVAVTYGDADGSAIGSIFCSPSDDSTNNAGTLTKVSGVGDSSIAFSYRSVGYSSGIADEDTCGHWVQLTKKDGEENIYPVNESVLGSCVNIDRIDFLVVTNSTFNIDDLSVRFKGIETKKTHRTNIEFSSNLYNKNEELFPSNRFGAAGVLDTNWNVTPTLVYEEINGNKKTYPQGCVSKVTVTDENVLSCQVASSEINGRMDAVLEIWCRYFPDVYTNGSGTQITEDSYDYNDVCVDFGTLNNKSKTNWVTLKDKVNTHWKIVRFPICIYNSVTTLFRIYSNNKGIEVAYVSLKEN